MSDAKKCDRCGKYYTPNRKKRCKYEGKEVGELHIRGLNGCEFALSADLCDQCALDILAFMHLNPDKNEPDIRKDIIIEYGYLFKHSNLSLINFLQHSNLLTPDEKREMIRLNKLENNIVVDEKGQVSYRNVCP